RSTPGRRGVRASTDGADRQIAFGRGNLASTRACRAPSHRGRIAFKSKRRRSSHRCVGSERHRLPADLELTHLANAAMIPRVNRICSVAGYQTPYICTPEELMVG